MFQYSLQVIYVMMVGQLGELTLLSPSIATSFVGVMGLHLLVRFTNFAIDLYFVIIGCFAVYKVMHDVSFLEKRIKRGLKISIVVFVLP